MTEQQNGGQLASIFYTERLDGSAYSVTPGIASFITSLQQ